MLLAQGIVLALGSVGSRYSVGSRQCWLKAVLALGSVGSWKIAAILSPVLAGTC